MIDRYSLPGMKKLWSEQTKFQTWLDIEILASEAQARLGVIPKRAIPIIKRKARFSVPGILKIEARVKHDVIAFLTNVAKAVGPESRYIHYGLTSSDVVDTALAYLMTRAGMRIQTDLEAITFTLKKLAFKYKMTPMIGRTHGVHAEPTTFGLKLLLWFEEMRRNTQRIKSAITAVAVGKISGAVGNFANVDPFVERYVCQKLGLRPAVLSTQVVPRDRHAEYMNTLALIAATVEKIATEIRHLARTEVGELEEPFSEGQRGSSAMPHKRNPVTCERLCGLARLVRSQAQVALENITLWHERDISHSSAERVIIPDATILVDYLLVMLQWILKNMQVNVTRMRKNLNATGGLIFSGRVLLALMQNGLPRDQAYQIVQSNAQKALKTSEPFRELVAGDSTVKQRLSAAQIEACFDEKPYFKQVDYIFKKVLYG